MLSLYILDPIFFFFQTRMVIGEPIIVMMKKGKGQNVTSYDELSTYVTISYIIYMYYPSSASLQSYAQAQSSALDYVFFSFFAHLLLITSFTDLVLWKVWKPPR